MTYSCRLGKKTSWVYAIYLSAFEDKPDELMEEPGGEDGPITETSSEVKDTQEHDAPSIEEQEKCPTCENCEECRTWYNHEDSGQNWLLYTPLEQL